MYTGNEITPAITKVCTSEIVPAVFFDITCATKLHV